MQVFFVCAAAVVVALRGLFLFIRIHIVLTASPPHATTAAYTIHASPRSVHFHTATCIRVEILRGR